MISSAMKTRKGFFVILLIALAACVAAPLFGATIKPTEVEKPQTGKVPFPRPGSHKGNWMEYHGSLVAAEGSSPGKPGKSCAICHEKSDCIACHETRLPRDHTNFWRTRSHGFVAEGNRQRCMICHRQEFCVRCHSETAPRSHTASWRTRHCTWCHYGSGSAPADNCVACHKAALHTSAPHTVNSTINCSLCHH
jgi:hypothetical protein